MNCRVISIFSSKGGVGKTLVAVNLATALSKSGKRVLLVDLDFQAGQDMARMLNLAIRNSIVDIIPLMQQGGEALEINEHATKHQSGLHFIPAVKTSKQIAHITPDNIKPFFRESKKRYDYIIIDAGRSFSEVLISALDFTNLILLVATPDILAVYQTKWCLEILQNLHFPTKMIKLILNRSESRGSVAWQEIRQVLQVEIFGHIPSDGKTVGMALNRGVPCYMDSPRSPVAEAFGKMVGMLKKDNLYIETHDVEKTRTVDGFMAPGAFWKKFGISQQSFGTSVTEYVSEEDDIISLKKRIHEKLVERLNLDGISTDALADPDTAQKIKKSAEQVVLTLLLDEAGGRISNQEDRTRIVRDIVNEALGLGPLEDFLADPDVTDIMANNKDEIYIEKNGKLIFTNKKFVSNDKMRSIIDRIIAPLGRRIDESTPMVDARLQDGSRINAIIPPLSLNGPMITIRKFGQERLEAEDLITRYQSMSKPMADFLKACVTSRKNLIVSGGTGAGKTTLLNVVSEYIPDGERIITIEDAAELKLKKSHWGRLESRPANVEGKGAVTIRDLFINCLRMRPDRIVVGECRGPEVLDMLQAMNTGHDGSMTTLHANSTRDVVTRMHSMILLSGIELPVRAINEMISSAVQVIVHINRYSDGTRKITGISETAGLSADFQLILKDIFIFRQKGLDSDGNVQGSFEATGFLPQCFDDFTTKGIPFEKSLFDKPAV
ncbi:MAG: Flp pilus assembly complex ATPase component TadA [Candidatus Omnitrophica bacterium]|nr:Flp pilus assembly complex ATPase component TadA [Candidatus Omnitrophota bacterium]